MPQPSLGARGIIGASGPIEVRRSRIEAGLAVSLNGPADGALIDRSELRSPAVGCLEVDGASGVTLRRSIAVASANNSNTCIVVQPQTGQDGELTVEDSTVYGASATPSGTGIGASASLGDAGDAAELTARNVIVRGFPNSVFRFADSDKEANVTLTFSDYDPASVNDLGGPGSITPPAGQLSPGANVNVDPLFVDPAGGDFELLPTSPVIDIGDPATAQGLDFGGDPLVSDGDGNGTARRDIGADEAVLDSDGDGRLNDADNCPLAANPGQANNDGDGRGDACDPDDDNDGVSDSADNCPTTANASQANGDGDALGDACDPTRYGTDVNLELTGEKVKAGRPVKAQASCPAEDCEVIAGATFKVPQAALSVAARSKKLQTKQAGASLEGGSPETLKLKLGGKAKKKLVRAAKRKRYRKQTKVLVKATATDLGGNAETEKLKLKLR